MGFSDSTESETSVDSGVGKEDLTPELVGQVILKNSDLSPDQIREQTKEKMEEYEGLVGKTAACILVGRENGLNMNEQLGIEMDSELDVENLVEDMNNLRIKVEVRKVWDINTFERDSGDDGRVRNVVVGDSTGETQMALWDDDVQLGEKLEAGDMILIKNAYSDYSDYNDRVEIGIGDETDIYRVSDSCNEQLM